ncbi:MAG: N(1)-aminopropylagmatine ureohydrolase [Lentisphaerae bacterium ADurb.BinA184]|nr:MAG: N(1)-aminopropylagmatine ureohydrolase [Lentisphaerae bacterium ADurb.BinA184]
MKTKGTAGGKAGAAGGRPKASPLAFTWLGKRGRRGGAGRGYRHFLEDDVPPSPPAKARFHIIPVPYEHSVSYGGGTADGPRAILEASVQLEAFDGTDVPGRAGLYTAPPVACAKLSPERMIKTVARAVHGALAHRAVPVVLGGEHTVTLGPVAALMAVGQPFGVVQFDAHADLREAYGGTPYSHACVMRRIVEKGIPVCQIGVRSCSAAEHEFRTRRRLPRLDAVEIARHGVPAQVLPKGFPRNLYITFDIDAFDSSLMPATGTPEPGGLFWFEAIFLLERVIRGRNVLGFDVVELAPMPGLAACDFAAAKLAYAIMGMVNRLGMREA